MLELKRNSSSSYFSSSLLKKAEFQNYNNNLNIMPVKNDINIKYKKAFDILNNVNNNKYTMKYIEEKENKLKSKNNENETINISNNISNCNRNNSPMNLNNNKNKNFNRNSSYLNIVNNMKNEKTDKHKNTSMKKNSIKINIKEKEKIKDNNNNIHEYKIDNMSSSYNNNFTNIKTNKIVFIDLKNNDNNFINNNLNNENQRYSANIIQNSGEDLNNNLVFRSSGSINLNNKFKNLNSININSNTANKSNTIKNKNDNIHEEKIQNSKNRNNLIQKNRFSNLNIQKLHQYNIKNIPNNCKILEDKKRNKIISPKIKNNLFDEIKNKGLSSKEISCYILSKSPILRLCERMILSRSSQVLRNILSKENILDEHETILKQKIEELKKKIILCDKILETPFIASKTAEITLNFITSLQEIEFKDYPIILANEEEKKYYINYLKIIYNILDEEIDNKYNENTTANQNNMIIFLKQNLYLKINNKGFKSLRDYIYNFFITKKDYIKEIPKIVEINYLVSQVNNMFEIHNSLKICKFISFTLYLIKEIVKFGNNIKSSIELKIKAKNLIDIINKKLSKYHSKYKKK